MVRNPVMDSSLLRWVPFEGRGLVFRKGEAIVRVRESGIVAGEQQVEEAIVQEVFDDAPADWIGPHMPLAEQGFELVGLKTIEDLAADFLADACLQAAQGAALVEANHSRMKWRSNC
jgi:hypothetical protein